MFSISLTGFSQATFPFSIFYPVFDTATFDQSAAIQDDSSLMFIGGYNIASTNKMHHANLIYERRQITARMQMNNDTAMVNVTMPTLGGNMEEDDLIKTFVIKGPGHEDSVFMIYGLDSLTLRNIYPHDSERPTRRSAIDGHDIGLSRGGYAAIVYRYDTVVKRYGDLSGNFDVQLQEIVISDARHRRVREIDLIDLFPPYRWNLKRSVRSLSRVAYQGREPFHINSLQLVDDTILLVSARALGLFSYDWRNGRLQWFIPEDTFGSSPVLQHNLRYIGDDTYSFFSDGDSSAVPSQGVVIRHTTDGWSVLRTFYPFSGPLHSFGLGSYQTDLSGSLNVINTGIEREPAKPVRTENVSTRTRAIRNDKTVFDLSISYTSCYTSRYIRRKGWGNEIIRKRKANKTILTAVHPFTKQVPVWYGAPAGSPDYQVIGRGDTYTVISNGLSSVFYIVEANDASGWCFQSRKMTRDEIESPK